MAARVSKPGLLSQIENDRTSWSPLQSQVDALVGGFVQQATDGRSLAAMMVGGMAYRLGRIGIMSTGAGNVSRFLSVGVGLGAEVTAFEMTNRSLASLAGEGHSSPNLWRWEGSGGLRQGLLSSLITFGSLKGAGRLAQGENVVVQHLLQDTGMVLGHQVSGFFGITPRPTGSLVEQFLHAEATNLQLSAGTSLGHGLTQGRIHALERGLDFSIRSTEPSPDHRTLQPALEAFPLSLQPVLASEERGLLTHVQMAVKTEEMDRGPRPFAPPENSEPLPLDDKGQQELVRQVQWEIESLLPDLRSRVSVNCHCAETFRLLHECSPKAFQMLMDLYFTPLERERLEQYRPMNGEMPPKFYSRIAGILAAKKAVMDLLGMDGAGHWAEIQFRYGRPELSGEAAARLGKRSLLMSASDDGLLGVGLALLEESPHSSGWVGVGLDITSDRVRYTTPAQHALGEAAYKATFPAHRIRRFGPRTAFEIQRRPDLVYSLAGQTAQAARRLRQEPESSEPMAVHARAFRIGEATAALVLIPASKDQLKDFPPFNGTDVSSPVQGSISPEETRWPEQIFLNGSLVRDFSRLDRVFSVLSDRTVSSRDLIRKLVPMPTGYQVRGLSFTNFSDGRLVFEGEVFSSSGWKVAEFKRNLAHHPDLYPSPLLAWGQGLDVASRHQEKGIGTFVALNEILFLRELGISHYLVPVGKKGGKFWPRLGFDFASPQVGQRLVASFEQFLREENVLLSVAKAAELRRIQHSWDLLGFTLENGRPIGKEFLLQPSLTWDSDFDLLPSSPSWLVLRKALQKMGQEHLLKNT